jgi:hypothetical protein
MVDLSSFDHFIAPCIEVNTKVICSGEAYLVKGCGKVSFHVVCAIISHKGEEPELLCVKQAAAAEEVVLVKVSQALRLDESQAPLEEEKVYFLFFHVYFSHNSFLVSSFPVCPHTHTHTHTTITTTTTTATTSPVFFSLLLKKLNEKLINETGTLVYIHNFWMYRMYRMYHILFLYVQYFRSWDIFAKKHSHF